MQPSARPIAKVLPPTTIVEDVPGNATRAAVIICHGMGQQLRWQTLCELVSSLTRATVVRHGTEVAVRQVRFKSIREQVSLGGDKESGDPFFLGRAEATLLVPGSPNPPRETHIYEAYWAPLTEGRITLSQTIRFLLNAGGNGIWHSFRKIARYDGLTAGGGNTPIREESPPYQNLVWFFSILLILCALIAMNLAITVTQLQHLFGEDKGSTRSLLAALTGDLWSYELVLLGAVLIFQGVLELRRRKRHGTPSWKVPTAASWALWGLVGIVAAVTVVIGLAVIPGHYWVHRALSVYEPATSIEYWLLRWPSDAMQGAIARALSWLNGHGLLTTAADERAWRALQLHAMLAWGAILYASNSGRRILVQYVGDVGIYVTSHTLSSFDQIRDDIKALVRRVVCAVYQQGRYERVIIVGHSLGSVIAYDALNGLMLGDSLSGAFDVQRTRRLVTFGSPLDKTAFVFRAVDALTAPIREGLAAAVQPLLIYRPSPQPTFDWVNLHSPHDIISGALDLYPQVINRRDLQADTPLWAHVQFWSNELLARTIAEACVDSPAGWPPGKPPLRYETAAATGAEMQVRAV
jgi:hypothetical protein